MTNRLIPTNAEPLYRQLMARIRDDVSSGVYPAESQIPSEQEMCARYGVSRVTVRRAGGRRGRLDLRRRVVDHVQLVLDAGWSMQQYRDWLVDTIERAVFAP